MFIPARFEELPVPPDEKFVLVKCTEKQNNSNDGQFRAEIWVMAIPKKGPVTGDVEKPPEKEPEKPAEEEEKGDDTEEKKKKKAPESIRNLEDYLEVFFPNWTPKPDGSLNRGGDQKEPPLQRFELREQKARLKGVAFSQEQNDRTIFVLCFSRSPDFADLQKVFERAAKSLRVQDTKKNLAPEIEAHYRVNVFRNVEYRKEVRANLSKGWKAHDTDNFILIYDTKDERLLAKIKNDLEAVRTKFIEMFPPAKEIEAVSTVRVCKDQDEFQKFSLMPPYVAGFWNKQSQELVFFDANADPDMRKSGAGRKDSYLVLYHEAFHQYIYYSCGEIDPHSWFNEGLGDYFGGAVIGQGGKKVDRIQANPWRVLPIQVAIASDAFSPLKKLVQMEQEEYYKKGELHYPQGWSLVYFLIESKQAQKHPVWNQIIPVYFETLKSHSQKEREKLTEKPTPEKSKEIDLASRKAAFNAAFKNVDFNELETAWKEFILKLKTP